MGLGVGEKEGEFYRAAVDKLSSERAAIGRMAAAAAITCTLQSSCRMPEGGDSDRPRRPYRY